MTFKDKTMLYLLNRSDIADSEYNDMLQMIRFHQVDEVDYLEIIIRKVRKDVYSEVLHDVMNLLGA